MAQSTERRKKLAEQEDLGCQLSQRVDITELQREGVHGLQSSFHGPCKPSHIWSWSALRIWAAGVFAFCSRQLPPVLQE